MWIDDITDALKKLGGWAHYSDLYMQLETDRENLSENYQAVVRRIIQQNSSDSQSYLNRHDLFYSVEGIGKGVWGLRKYNINLQDNTESRQPLGTMTPSRMEYNISRIIRDTALSRFIKKQHDHRCEICLIRLELSPGHFYSEAHHIMPLGSPHHGPDISENIIIACPNCHVQLDNFAIRINDTLRKRKIGKEYIEYHNSLVKK